MGLLDKLFKPKKDKPITCYADFWEWFGKNEALFYNAVKGKPPIDEKLMDLMMEKLTELKDGLFFQIGMCNNTVAELIITTDGVKNKFMLAKELIDSAPTNDRWRFTWLKPPLTFGISINAYGYKFCETTISFYANDNASTPDEIDIMVVYHYMNEEDRPKVINGTFIYLESVLGEWNFATQIDSVTVVGKAEAKNELIPINKLRDYITWREKEFTEKYEGVRYNTANDTHSVMEATTKEGKPAIFTVNRDLLRWDAKASHPWIVTVRIHYKGNENGMPDKNMQELMYVIQDSLVSKLKDKEGYLNIGRETVDNTRNIYFACKDFLWPCKVADDLILFYKGECEMEYNIYKDKYWSTFDFLLS